MNKKYIYLVVSIALIFFQTTYPLVNTVLYSIVIVPLAITLGELTSIMSEYIGEKKGGLLTAAIGNIPELTMGIWLIQFGMIPMVKASLIGSIISNMLLVLGVSIFVGGIKYKEQKFNRIVARTNFSMLLLAMSTIIIVASLKQYNESLSKVVLTSISIKIAVVLVIVYVLGLIFSLYTHSNLFIVSEQSFENRYIKNRKYVRIVLELIVISIILYFISERLIYNIKETVENYGISQEFLGIILIPILGNAGENFSAIVCASKNKVNLSLEIAIGSSIQIALFVTPILMVLAYFIGVEMTLLFTGFQIIMALIAIVMAFIVFQDGKTYWFEGAILIAIYIIVTLAYYYVV
ncbi:calcium/proton exchanger [Clostridium sp. OS1-26]|uniref:calcium/proton exchanger n=1 Tax=Clostridium sp. OS1-26 TaxID=3070681 RepID=UPI0027E19622|nr:calcium/proton exchanger [Clostridium sp. OS1-26]WML36650.1 calcium/proton exchanger [Clostridium sp. OS1-26]